MSKVTNTTEEAKSEAGALRYIFGGSNAIENSEREGQRELIESSLLPVDLSNQRPMFKALGFVFGNPVEGDPLFQHVTLPAGWTRQSTDHAMHSDILDENGRKRVGVFYKAAFYDRRASAHLVWRWNTETKERGVYPSKWRVRDYKTDTVAFDPGDVEGYDECNAWLRENAKGTVVEQWAAE